MRASVIASCYGELLVPTRIRTDIYDPEYEKLSLVMRQNTSKVTIATVHDVKSELVAHYIL